MKGKFSLTLIIGLTTFILAVVTFAQFKSVKQTDITAIEMMRESELRDELTKVKSKYDEIDEKYKDTENKLNEYKEKKANEEEAIALLEQEINEARMYMGYTKVKGEGIIITINEGNSSLEAGELLQLIYYLKNAGAEAISINGNRVVVNTDIVDINEKYILINGKRISGPYEIKAIGNQKYLESSFTFKNGFVDLMEIKKCKIQYTLEDDVEILPYDGKIELQYSTVVD